MSVTYKCELKILTIVTNVFFFFFLDFFVLIDSCLIMQEKFQDGVCPKELSAGILSTNISWNGIGFQLFWFWILLGLQK